MKMKKTFALFVLFLMASVSLIACSNKKNGVNSATNPSGSEETDRDDSANDGKDNMTDDIKDGVHDVTDDIKDGVNDAERALQ